MMKRTPLRKVSKKHARELRKYRKLKAAFLTNHIFCEFPDCLARSQDVHHAQGRGKNLNNVNTWVMVCRKHHDWIHSHAKEARNLGLLT